LPPSGSGSAIAIWIRIKEPAIECGSRSETLVATCNFSGQIMVIMKLVFSRAFCHYGKFTFLKVTLKDGFI
jgi:hypothetical protein